MKIAILGSAPSSMGLAPFGDPSWQIWGCSPGLYAHAPRVDQWFELHRWEPPVIGRPAQQVPWFSPEYVAWMAKQKKVWMYEAVSEIPNSDAYPVEIMVNKFGNYFMTSSIAWMMAMAIDQILKEREQATPENPHDASQDAIGLFGVDMAASEEYGYQRAGCQYFIQMCMNLGIRIVVPPESDVLRPMPLYGIDESSHFVIKHTARLKELQNRKAGHEQQVSFHTSQVHALAGAIDDMLYYLNTWHGHEPVGTHVEIWARSPYLNQAPAPSPVAVNGTVWNIDRAAGNPYSSTAMIKSPDSSTHDST